MSDHTNRPKSGVHPYFQKWLPEEVPTGKVGPGRVSAGSYLALPVLAWVVDRAVVLAAALLDEKTQRKQGTIAMRFPVTPTTEAYIVAVLGEFGWDGRVWPDDPGWPTGTFEERAMWQLVTGAGLSATFTFPPTQRGALAHKVTVPMTGGLFSLDPLVRPAAVQPDAERIQKLRQLCADPKVFHSLPEDPEHLN